MSTYSVILSFCSVDRDHKVLLLTALLLSVFQSIPQLTKSAPLTIATEGQKQMSLKAKKSLKKVPMCMQICSLLLFAWICNFTFRMHELIKVEAIKIIWC